MKKYDKLKNRGFSVDAFKDIGSGIIVQEKLDGSNASFTINAETGELEVFSRKIKLDENNTLNGFYHYVKELVDGFDDTQKEMLKYVIVFGEWLVKHKVQYKEDAYKNFYVFDVYSKIYDFYTGPGHVIYACEKFNLKQVKTFVRYSTYDLISGNADEIDTNIRSFIGKSELTEDGLHGEGIVIKNDYNRSTDFECYKIVTDTFKEFSKRKMNNEKKSNESVADYAITRARMEKQIFKAIDEDKLRKEDIVIENFGKVIKEVGQNFVDDIFEEEMEQMKKIIEKQIKRKMPIILREILQDETFLN